MNRLTIDCHIPKGLCSASRWWVASTSNPARSRAAVTPRVAVKCVRWRGSSRWYQRSPPMRACQLARLGTPTSSPPPGRSQPWIARSAAPGSLDVLEDVPERHGVDGSRRRWRASSIPARVRPTSNASCSARDEGSIPVAAYPARARRGDEPAAARAGVDQHAPAAATSRRASRRRRAVEHRQHGRRERAPAAAATARTRPSPATGGGSAVTAVPHDPHRSSSKPAALRHGAGAPPQPGQVAGVNRRGRGSRSRAAPRA